MSSFLIGQLSNKIIVITIYIMVNKTKISLDYVSYQKSGTWSNDINRNTYVFANTYLSVITFIRIT